MSTRMIAARSVRLAGWVMTAAAAAAAAMAVAGPPVASVMPRMASAAQASAATRGRETFVRVGCSECHGTAGQGSGAGRRLAPDPLPLAALIPYVRAATGQMPSYGDTLVTDAELADIRAYLASIPPARPPASIPALRDLRDSD